jgi:hypothetical protein
VGQQPSVPGRYFVGTENRSAVARSACWLSQRSDLRSWEPSSLPDWLNEEVYANKIQPPLKDIANPVIMSALGVSVTYAVAIRAGRRRPHPRQWEALAELVGVLAERSMSVIDSMTMSAPTPG